MFADTLSPDLNQSLTPQDQHLFHLYPPFTQANKRKIEGMMALKIEEQNEMEKYASWKTTETMKKWWGNCPFIVVNNPFFLMDTSKIYML